VAINQLSVSKISLVDSGGSEAAELEPSMGKIALFQFCLIKVAALGIYII